MYGVVIDRMGVHLRDADAYNAMPTMICIMWRASTGYASTLTGCMALPLCTGSNISFRNNGYVYVALPTYPFDTH